MKHNTIRALHILVAKLQRKKSFQMITIRWFERCAQKLSNARLRLPSENLIRLDLFTLITSRLDYILQTYSSTDLYL